MHPLLALLPLIVLVVAMTAPVRRLRLPMSAERALPASAALALGLHLVAPIGDPEGAGRLVPLAARVIEGLLAALTPLSIVFGATLLFRTLHASGAMRTITDRLGRALPDPVMRVLLIAWAFSYLIEGLSGFGTPAVLAAPILVGLGFPAIRVAAACLAMNTVPVVFGAVGTPMWFGLGELDLSRDELRSVAGSAAALQLATAPVVVMLALRMLFAWNTLRARAVPIMAIVFATVGGSFATSFVSVEFPSIVGGLCGMAVVGALGRTGRRNDRRPPEPAPSDRAPADPPPAGASSPPIWRAAAPLIGAVLLLGVTRLEPLGLRQLLTSDHPAATLQLGALGTFSISPALVVGLDRILGTEVAWSMPLLYVPFIVPFVLVSLIAAPILGLSLGQTRAVWREAVASVTGPAVALAGALVLVKLMMHGGPQAPAMVIGDTLARAIGAVDGELWISAAVLLGALGSFFSGSATVSNLTFAPVQDAVAARLGLDRPAVLAMQTTGAAMGNMVCIHNIVAVAAVLGLSRKGRPGAPAPNAEDAGPPDNPVVAILRLTIVPLAACLTVAGVAAWFL